MKNLRLLALSAASLAFAAWLGACSTQPVPPCPVANGSPLGVPPGNSPLGDSLVQFALPNWWAGYTLKSGSGACADLGGEEIGMQRFETPGKEGLTLGIRSFRMGYTRGNADGYGSFDYVGGDFVTRSDPSDPDGTKMSAIGKLANAPAADNTCAVTEITPAEQSFQEEVFAWKPGTSASTVDQGGNGIVDADAGTITFPAKHMLYEWMDVKVIDSSIVPGQLFTATVKITDDACIATYDVKGVWPITLCRKDLDCHPYALPDAGDDEITIAGRRFQGSGLNPSLETAEHPFKCNLDPKVTAFTARYADGADPESDIAKYAWGVCEVDVPYETFQK